MLFIENPLARLYRRAADMLGNEPNIDFSITFHSDRSPSRGHRGQFLRPATGEIAAVVPTSSSSITPYRDIVVRRRGQGILRIDELHPLYDPLHYVLMFPRGEQGWCAPTQGRSMRQIADPDDDDDDSSTITPMRFYAYMLQDREGHYLVHYGRLFHQYAVDMYV